MKIKEDLSGAWSEVLITRGDVALAVFWMVHFYWCIHM